MPSILDVTLNGETTATPLLSSGFFSPHAAYGGVETVVKLNGQLYMLHATADATGDMRGFITTPAIGTKTAAVYLTVQP